MLPAAEVACFRFEDAQVAEMLALGEALLERTDPERRTIFVNFWRPVERAVVLGSACRLALDVHAEACRERGIPIYRRATGGGTVALGPETWCYSFVWSKPVDPGTIEDAFGLVHGAAIEALAQFGLTARCVPICDLVVDVPGRGTCKIAGHGQRRRRTGVICAGSLLAAPFPYSLDEILKHPPREPPYREGRTHDTFLTNLAALGVNVRFTDFVGAMRGGLAGAHIVEPDGELLGRAAELVREKYEDRAWTERL